MSGIDTIELGGAGQTISLTVERFDEVVSEFTGRGRAADGVRELVTGGAPDARYPVPAGQTFIEPLTNVIREFIPAPDIQAIAEALIARHPALGFLANLRIDYFWKQQGGSEGDEPRFGRCERLSGLSKHYGQVHFAIWLAADHCHLAAMTAWQVEARVCHELCHAGMKSGKAAIRPHDFAGFHLELREYGAWQADLAQMVRAAQQLPLSETWDEDADQAASAGDDDEDGDQP